MSNSPIIITGAAGFLGRAITQYLSTHDIIAVGRHVDLLQIDNVVSRIEATLPDPELEQCIVDTKPVALIHCAGSGSVPFSMNHPYGDFKKTVEPCAYVLDVLRRYNLDTHFIYLSSAAVYGNPSILPIAEDAPLSPISPYGYHKLLCEKLIEEYGSIFNVKAAVLRIFSAFGPGLNKQVVYDLCRRFMSSDRTNISVFGAGDETRDFVHGDDVAQAVKLVLDSASTGVFNVAGGKETTIRELVELIRCELHSRRTALFTGATRPGDPKKWRADISKIRKLGFSPKVDLSNGIQDVCSSLANEAK